MADIFGENTIETEQDALSITADTLVGDGRKYKTTDELATAYANADSFIEKLKARDAEREAELKVLRDIAEARSKAKETPAADDDKGRQSQPDPVSLPKVEDIGELVRQELQNSKQTERRTENINKAAKAMTNHYGSEAKAQEAIRRRAEELGVGFDWLRDVAADSPSAFFASMGVSPDSRSSATPSYSNEAVRRSSEGVRDFSYWDDMRKNNPKVFYSADVQKQMFTARRELGDKFYKST